MPHLIVEHSSNLVDVQAEALLLCLNQALVNTGIVKAEELKSRVHCNQTFLVGLGDLNQAYIHAHLYLLAGRNDADKKVLADQAIAALEQFNGYQAQGLTVQLSLQMTDMPSLDYRKQVIQY